jgi:hypothetical protein
MATDPEKDSEPAFSCKVNLDLKVREKASVWPWLVAFMAAGGFLWGIIERLIGSVD